MEHTLGAAETEGGRTPSSSTAEREVEAPIDLSNLASMAAVEVGFCGEVLRWNSGAEDLLGIAGAEAVGHSASSVIGEVLLAPALLERVLAGLRGEAWSGPERLLRRDRSLMAVQAWVVPVRAGALVMCQDITSQERADRAAAYRNTHDPETRLPNRLALQEVIQRLARAGGGGLVVLVSLDDLETATVMLSPEDLALVLDEVVTRLEMAAGGEAVIGRVADDHFVAIVPAGSALSDPDQLAGQVTGAFEESFALAATSILVRASVGVASFESAETDGAEPLRRAAASVRRARCTPQGFHVFDPDTHQLTLRRKDIEAALRDAADGEGLALAMQPIVQAYHWRRVGYEALLRWEHPRLGQISPEEFIPVAEDTGHIVPLGVWVLNEAARMARWLVDAGESATSVAVNLSARQLYDGRIVEALAGALAHHQLNPASLCLELTESQLMNDSASTVARLHELQQMGVRLAIDDFGTGYSSLAYLRRFRIDSLKIDRSFVTDIDRSPDDRAIVAAIIRMAGELGMGVIAEGVETVAQRDRLADLGCRLFQGYLFGRPTTQLEPGLATT